MFLKSDNGRRVLRALSLVLATASAIAVGTVGCTNSGLGVESAGTAETGSTGGNCPWVGEWEMQQITCSSFDAPEWVDDYGKATMTIENASGGGCAVVANVTDQACNQEETWHFTEPVGSAVDIEMDGTTGCQPQACEFPGGAVCTRGAGARTITGGYIADIGGELEARDLLADTLSLCQLDVVTRWARK